MNRMSKYTQDANPVGKALASLEFSSETNQRIDALVKDLSKSNKELEEELTLVLSPYEETIRRQCKDAFAKVDKKITEDQIVKPEYLARMMVKSLRPELPQRVNVWDGNKESYLGQGEYCANVTVYLALLPDGTIVSNRDAETPIEPWELPRGSKSYVRENHPKIKLDSGKVVYGGQVWWGPALDEGINSVVVHRVGVGIGDDEDVEEIE